jgi:FPC/CPF motif-containing protein YcgG
MSDLKDGLDSGLVGGGFDARLGDAARGRILDQADMNGPAIPRWLAHSYREFRDNVLGPGYPCYLGKVAEQRGELRYGYVDEWTPEGLAHVPGLLSEFVALAKSPESAPVRRDVQGPGADLRQYLFVLFIQPDPQPLGHDAYGARFWSLLELLRQRDAEPWPADIPMDPHDSKWTFAFGGIGFFVFLTAPTYQKRRSRNLGPGMAVMFQPRNVFDGLEGDTPEGRKARARIRALLGSWDRVAPHPDLGWYGDSSNREWKQFVLPDDEALLSGQCPFLAGAPGRKP